MRKFEDVSKEEIRELLGLKFTSVPQTVNCLMHTQGHCSGEFRFQF
jgi:hypothetical protein